MRIVDWNTFKQMPEGTVFMKYESYVFDELCIKGESIDADFFYSQLLTDEIAELSKVEKDSSYSIDIDFNSCCRDGTFAGEQLYAVYERRDIEGLIEKLRESLTHIEGGKHEA